MTRHPLVLASLLLAAATADARAVDVSPDEVPLSTGLALLVDDTGATTIDDVRTPEVAARFTPWTGRFAPSFGFTSAAVWARLTLDNPEATTLERWLEADQSTLDSLELYGPGATLRRAGRLEPLDSQELRRPTYAFRLRLPPGRSELFLRATSQNELQLSLTVWERGALEAHDVRRTLVLALAYGFLLAMALYNLFLAAFTRDPAHGWYAAYVVMMGTWLSLLDGTLPMFLPASIGVLPRWPFLVTATLGWLASATFARRLLELAKERPRLDEVVRNYQAFMVLAATLEYAWLDWRDQNRLSSVLMFANVAVLFGVGVVRWRDGSGAARYYVAAFAALTGCFVVAGLATQGFLPFPGPGFLVHAGLVAEALVLSMALAEGARRRNAHIARLHEAGRRFVPFEFLRLLQRTELPEVRPGDQVERHMAVLFADVRGFTALAEGMTPAATIALVNDWVRAMEAPIRASGGFIDKFIGDAVMALFETPAAALEAAKGCVAAVQALNAARPGAPPIRIGLGVHAGPLVLGTVGSEERLSCTVLGDTVNLASRLESLTKRYGASVLVSGEAHAGAGAPAGFRAIDRVAVKGKRTAVEVFELVENQIGGGTRRSLVEARALLDARDPACVPALERLVSDDPSDVPARLLLETAKALVANGFEGWDGITRPLQK